MTQHWWFHATEAVKSNKLEKKKTLKDFKALKHGDPQKWVPFDMTDASLLEAAYNTRLTGNKDITSVAVKGEYLVEVDMENMVLRNIYWDGAEYPVRRSLWFYRGESEFVPCDERFNDEIESCYQEFIKESVTQEGEAPKVVESFLKDPYYRNLEITFISSKKKLAWIHDASLAVQVKRSLLNYLASKDTTGKAGFSGYLLIRTFAKYLTKHPEKMKIDKTESNQDSITRIFPFLPKVPANISDQNFELNNLKEEDESANVTPPPGSYEFNDRAPDFNDYIGNTATFDSLVFLVHGMGQKAFEKVEDQSIVAVAEKVRKLKEKLCPKERIMILPIRWRTILRMDSTGGHNEAENMSFEEALQNITLNNISKVREVINDVIVDVLLFMSPAHSKAMKKTVIDEMNRLYKLFISRHPLFLKNKGKVSIYSHSLGSVIVFDLLKDPSLHVLSTAQADPDLPKFCFPVDKFFACGSPIGFFVILRGLKLRGTIGYKNKDVKNEDSKCVTLYCREFYNIFHPYDPVVYRIEPTISAELKNEKPGGLTSQKSNNIFEKTMESIQNLASFRSVTPEPVLMTDVSDSTKILASFNSQRRIDFALDEEGIFNNAYIASFQAHQNYWFHEECTCFILKKSVGA